MAPGLKRGRRRIRLFRRSPRLFRRSVYDATLCVYTGRTRRGSSNRRRQSLLLQVPRARLLRALVGKLEARVEGLQLGGVGGGGRQRALGGNTDADHIPSQDQFNQEAAARARTALELRIGEFEEIESNHQKELDSLYKNSQSLTLRNTLLAKCAVGAMGATLEGQRGRRHETQYRSYCPFYWRSL